MSNCVIISGGSAFKNDFNYIKEDDFVICADSGYKYALKHNIKVNLIVGDFDSFKGEIPTNIETVKLNKIKDDTDSFHATLEGIKRGYKNFIFIGALGKREEHTFANISILIYLKNRGFAGLLVKNRKKFVVLKNEKMVFSKKNKGFFSVFSLSEKSKNVSIKNLKYTVENITLDNEFALGIDNEYIGLSPEVEVKNGILLVVY